MRHDIVIVGGGHNALTAAFYLAKAGRKPLLLERRPVVGGCATSEEFAPGYRGATLAHALGPLRPSIVRDMQLERRGVKFVRPDPRLVAVVPDGRALVFSTDPGRTAEAIRPFSAKDAARYPEFCLAMARIGEFLSDLIDMTPPSIDSPSAGELWDLLKTGRKFPAGGPGAVTRAMAEAARKAGAEIRTGAEVRQILVKDGVAAGVLMADGSEIPATTVVSSADPKRTFLRLIDPIELEPGFITRMRNYRVPGTVAKINFALRGLPAFRGLSGDAAASLRGRVHVGPGIDYLERAFDASKYGESSAAPYLDIAFPSIADPSIAPVGHHVMSVHMQYVPYTRRAGSWNGQEDVLAEAALRALENYAPGVSALVEHRQVITPLALEQVYGLTGGHIYHGELALDQLFTMRPTLGWADYGTPIDGLYLCGSGTHPGNGLTGASGRNAAREILKRAAPRKTA